MKFLPECKRNQLYIKLGLYLCIDEEGGGKRGERGAGRERGKIVMMGFYLFAFVSGNP